MTNLQIFYFIAIYFITLTVGEDKNTFLDVTMPGYIPTQDEQYVCVAVEVTDPGYVVEFLPSATADRTHHMLAYGCDNPPHAPGEAWECEHGGTCNSAPKILYAWARNAPALALPPGVGVPIGKGEGVSYVVLQMHYAKKFGGQVYDYSGVRLRIASQQPTYLAGIYLFMPSASDIPAHTKTYFMNASCVYPHNALVHPFAFRPHTHALGRIVSAYKYSENTSKWTQIGKGNPQWPQRFYPIDNGVTISHGDILFAQCLYDSTGRDHSTSLGAHGHDEMCNFYMYYYVDAKEKNIMNQFSYCGNQDRSDLFAKYPVEAITRFAPNPDMEESAKQSEMSFSIKEKDSWPKWNVTLGQIGGLALDKNGNIVVFHRGERVWGEKTFDLRDNYMEKSNGPITEDVLITVSPNGSEISRWGKSFFYLPHGIFIDENDYVWLTDVALHQVFKFDIKQSTTKPLLTLGKQFEHGTDVQHFCKPAGVAVASGEGTIFVADGYCNNRIMKFAPDGKFLGSWGEASQDIVPGGHPKLGTFSLPHGLSLDDSHRRVFIADRENARVQIFTFDGTALGQLVEKEFGDSVYGVFYCAAGDTIFVINGPAMTRQVELRVFAFDGSTQRLLYSWRPQASYLERPHAILASKDCAHIYVGEIGPNKLWRFDINSTGRRAPTSIGNQSKTNHTGKVVNGNRKPDTANDANNNLFRTEAESTLKLIVILFIAIGAPILLIVMICCCIRIRKRGNLHKTLIENGYGKKKGKNGLFSDGFRDHKGFRPLSTEDIDASDESEDSDAEHTLYKNFGTRKA